MNNKMQIAMIWLAVLEVLVCCVAMPLFMARAQEIELVRELEGEEVLSADLSSEGAGYRAEYTSSLSLDEKIDVANSYDNTVTTIILDKGENYTANQICSISAGELENIYTYYAETSPITEKLSVTALTESMRNFGIFLEEQSHEDNKNGVGYADVETVDEVDVDADSVYINGDNEVGIRAMMYVNSAEPDQIFIVWQINYYNFKDDSTIFVIVDDETGKLLSITGNFGGDQDDPSNSLYSNTEEIKAMLSNYYAKQEQNISME